MSFQAISWWRWHNIGVSQPKSHGQHWLGESPGHPLKYAYAWWQHMSCLGSSPTSLAALMNEWVWVVGVVSHQASFQTPIQDFISGKLIPMTLSRVRITQSIYYLLQGSDPWCLTLNHGRKKVCNSSVQRVNCHINYWAIRLTVAPAALTLILQLIILSPR